MTSESRPTTTTATAAAASTGASDLNTRGYELMLAGRYGAALPLLQQAVAGLGDPSDPVTAYANFNLGQTLVRLGRCGDALPYLERATRLEPTSREAGNALSYARTCAGGASARVAVVDREPPGRRAGQTGYGHGHLHGNPHA